MQMDEGLDTGDILEVAKVKLDEKETGGSLFDRLSVVGAELLVETLKKAESGELHPVKQDDNEATYVKMLNKSFGLLDFTKKPEVLERMVRGLNPWPSAFTHIEGKLLKIWDASVEAADDDKECGSVVTDQKTYFKVKCDGGYLVINELQLEGKKRMKTADFLRGYSVKDNEKLG